MWQAGVNRIGAKNCAYSPGDRRNGYELLVWYCVELSNLITV